MLLEADSTGLEAVGPEVGSDPGWPLVLYFHHVRADLEHYTVLRPADFAFALDLIGRWFRPLDPRCLAEPPHVWPDEPTCLLTFDDGYRDVWEHAVPAMEERGWRAAMFVCTDQIGAVQDHPQRGALEHMTWGQLRELEGRGHVIGCHGHTHRDMSRLSAEDARAEIATAQRILARELGPGPMPLAYPYGHPPEAFEALSDLLPRFCFGSVKAPPAPWTDRPSLVRRTYLPAGARERWQVLIEGWRRRWERTASP
jgi:peptidoglycan/xylan/chitin deacetylase (PgdA/CDA1 family)